MACAVPPGYPAWPGRSAGDSCPPRDRRVVRSRVIRASPDPPSAGSRSTPRPASQVGRAVLPVRPPGSRLRTGSTVTSSGSSRVKTTSPRGSRVNPVPGRHREDHRGSAGRLGDLQHRRGRHGRPAGRPGRAARSTATTKASGTWSSQYRRCSARNANSVEERDAGVGRRVQGPVARRFRRDPAPDRRDHLVPGQVVQLDGASVIPAHPPRLSR